MSRLNQMEFVDLLKEVRDGSTHKDKNKNKTRKRERERERGGGGGRESQWSRLIRLSSWSNSQKEKKSAACSQPTVWYATLSVSMATCRQAQQRTTDPFRQFDPSLA